MCRKVSSLDLHATTRTVPANTWGSVRHHWPELTITVAGIIGLNILAQRYWQWEQDFFVSELCIASLTLVAPWLFAAARGWIDHLASPLERAVTIDDQTAPQWLHMQVSGLLDRWSPIIVGFILAAFGVISLGILGAPWRGWIGGLFYLWFSCFLFAYGVLGWVFGALLVLIWRISLLPVRCTVFRWPTAEIGEIYNTYLRFLVAGSLLYITAVVAVLLSPGGQWIATTSILGRLWVFPPAAAAISFFLMFHFRVHVMLKRCKLKAEAEISDLLDQAFQEWKTSRDAKQQETITELIQWRDIIRNASEWPMRLQSVLATIATLLLPTIKTIVELVTK